MMLMVRFLQNIEVILIQAEQILLQTFSKYMAEQYQFANRFSLPSSDRLEHYRLEIRKLQQLNIKQKQAYSKKIAALQQSLYNGNTNNHAHQSSHLHPNNQAQYIPSSTISIQIVKRDKQINQLSQQNQRLKRLASMNPDHELITKKKNMFNELADKDNQIQRLKKAIYQLQGKFQGKFSNDTRLKNQYTILEEENKKLRKQLEQYAKLTNKDQSSIINNELLEGLKYKKEAELLNIEKQHIANQYRKLIQEYTKYRYTVQEKVGSLEEIQLLRKDLKDSNIRNSQLISYAKQLQNKNSELLRQNLTYRSRIEGSIVKPVQKQYEKQGQRQFEGISNYKSSQSSRKRKSYRIFDDKNKEKETQQNLKKRQQQRKIRQQEAKQYQKFIDQRKSRLKETQEKIISQLQNQGIQKNKRDNRLTNDYEPIYNGTQKKRGGFYDRYQLNQVVKKDS